MKNDLPISPTDSLEFTSVIYQHKTNALCASVLTFETYYLEITFHKQFPTLICSVLFVLHLVTLYLSAFIVLHILFQ